MARHHRPPGSRALLICLLGGLAPALLAQPISSGDDARASPSRADRHDRAAAPSQAEWLARARTLEKHRDWQGLMALGLQWTWADSDNALAWFVLGRAYNGLRRYPEAIAAYQRNLHLDPGDILARNNLGNAYRDSKRYRDALLAYREAVRINPDYLPAWNNLGRTFYVMKGQVGVIDAVERVRRVNPELAAAWYSLMVGYYQTRDDAAAREALELLRRMTPEETDRLFGILLDRAR
jgi:tetratricopeptide (TPR) repeat protein